MAAILMASLCLLGWRQGVVRVAFSLVGIFIGALLAAPLGKLIRPIIGMVGVKNTVLLGILPPVIGFGIVLMIFKIAGFSVHRKVDVHFKYKVSDLKVALWERLDHRLGLCLGLFNGALYFVLLAWGIYALSYWTVQASTAQNQPTTLKVLNTLGKDLDKTGFDKVARSIDRFPNAYYETADIVGLVYNNSLLEARLSNYPAFLTLGEKPEFQDIAHDNQFTEMRQNHEPILKLIDYPKTQALLKNPALMKDIRAVLVPNLKDLKTYLETGKSPKFDEQPILGRWDFDLNYTVFLLHKAKPNISATQLKKEKQLLAAAFSKASLVATTENEVFLKNVPKTISGTPSGDLQNVKGKWEGDGGKYIVSVANGGGDLAANADMDRLTLQGEGVNLAFTRED
ncbi:MAG TPA: CvpA family protein [Verrucomicrobiae bacterium]|nr:CvpA family protein [Verrucomicrobiae bacterium]